MATCEQAARSLLSTALLAPFVVIAPPAALGDTHSPTRIEIQIPAGMQPDLFTVLGACHDALYLLTTPRTATVLVIDTRTRAVRPLSIREIQPTTAEPTTMGVDCARGMIYAVDRRAGVSVIAAATGTLVRTFALPQEFGPVPNVPAVSSTDGTALAIAGFWVQGTPESFFARPLERAFLGGDQGLLLSLDTGTWEPLFRKAGTECPATIGVCTRMPFDRDGASWMLGHGAFPRFQLSDRTRRLHDPITVTAQGFQQSSTAVPSNGDREAAMRWAQRYTQVNGVFAFGENVALVFGRVEDRVGDIAQFETWLLIATRDGRALGGAVPLADLPVGRDETGVYVLDYGGRRRQDARNVAILHYRVTKGP